ncbi:sacsin N-terminal ATP-binding-like domain-containing protein [Nocardia sp. CDC160]|uniref:sacsin N-terminal ATP-binding-like domain-containing protein n=1 Tax=Nocardia sp. CDC160 TaxID=3112166 RepID=UPI002DB9889E|nr:ATP-binding protein [Nocardia sp. CDC160]MEC3913515.1 ATP-binding protein [Nocardia sp. CDC160]
MVAAWRGSPTRLREDAATEADLVRSGYRDRLLTELAQNAADAAVKAGVPGRVAVWLDGRTLHVANSGAALDVSGVHALTALRASGKTEGAAVGKFGVGFTAVLTVSDEVELRSTSGSVRFSRAETWALLGAQGIEIPEVPGGFEPPALRLAWAIEERPADGFDSEIVLRLREDVDTVALLAEMRAEAADLLLELPALHRIRINDDEITRVERDLERGLTELRVTGPNSDEQLWWQFRTERARWLLPVRDGRPVAAHPDVLRAPTRSDEELSIPALLIADIPMQPDRRRLLPGAHLPDLATGYADFARALPPRDRLVLVPLPGFARSEADSALREALVAELRDNEWLPVLTARTDTGGEYGVPPADLDAALGLPEATADAESEAAGNAESEAAADPVDASADRPAPAASGARPVKAWEQEMLPLWDLPQSDDSASDAVEPRGAVEPHDAIGPHDVVATFDTAESGDLADLEAVADLSPLGMAVDESAGTGTGTDSWGAVAAPRRASVFTGVTAELADHLADMVGPLVIPELSGRMYADALSVLDVHRIGLARIAELSSSLEREPQWWYSLYDALESFAVDPLAVEELGALAVPLTDGRLVTGPRTVVLDDRLESAIPVHWARLVHPEAAHELLGRLGARQASPEDLLNDPGLRAVLEDDPSDPDTVDAVLKLAAHTLAAPGMLPSWLGLLELPDVSGESTPADELLLPDAPLGRVLVEDSPFATVAEDVLETYGPEALRAIGVGWGFTLVAESDPTGPDHHLDDEETWWEGLAEDPAELIAVRDLDLVDDGEWPEALRLLLSDPTTRPLLADRDGYTAWWLRQHAHIDGIPLGLMRHPDDTLFSGLLPQLPGFDATDLTVLRGVLADPEVLTTALAEELLDALADPARRPGPESISRTYQLLAEALDAGRLDTEELVLPGQVRALSGEVIPAADALVLDRSWFGPALPVDRLVVGDITSAKPLATLLDLPLASEAVTAEVVSTGRETSWAAEPLGVLLRLQFDFTTPPGELVVHDELRVRLSGAYEATVAVAWWHEDGVTHVQAQPQNLARR